MPVPTSLATLSQTPTSNSPDGGDNVFPLLDNYMREMFADFARLRDGAHQLLVGVSGTNTITATNAHIATYVTGQSFILPAAGANTGPVSLNINGIGARNVIKNGNLQLSAGDIPAGKLCRVEYDGSQFQLTGYLYRDFIGNLINVYNNDASGYARLYFEVVGGSPSTTYIRGFGTGLSPLLSVQDAGNTAKFKVFSDGTARLGADAANAFDATTLQQVQALDTAVQAAAISAATSAATTAAQNSALGGPAQSYQNVIGSRSAGVQYTNSTGRPIEVTATGISSGGSPQQGVIFGTVNGLVVKYTSPFSNAGNYEHPISFIVPAGATYQVDLSNLALSRWVELR